MFLQCSGPDLPQPCTSCVRPPTVHSRRSFSIHPALSCSVVRSQSWGLQQIILPTGSPTQLQAAEHREPAASENAEQMPFRKNLQGLATITHLANATGRGFILWATLDRIISLYSAQQQALRFVKGQLLLALLIY